MNLPEVEKQILEKNKQIKTIQAQLADKKKELESKRKAYSEGLIANTGRERKLSSLDTQKQAVISVQAEEEALTGARDILQAELAELERQKNLAELSQTQGERFRKSLAASKKASSELKALMTTLVAARNSRPVFLLRQETFLSIFRLRSF